MDTIMEISVVAINKPKLYVEVDALNSVLLYQWKGRILDNEARAGFLAILDFIRKHEISNIIADVSKFEGGMINTVQWINDKYSEMLKEAGVQKIAVTVPKCVFGEFSARTEFGEKIVTLLDVKKFSCAEDAYIWFEQ